MLRLLVVSLAWGGSVTRKLSLAALPVTRKLSKKRGRLRGPGNPGVVQRPEDGIELPLGVLGDQSVELGLGGGPLAAGEAAAA